MPSRVATILVNWNGWKDTLDCIDSVLGAGVDGPVIVVDNDSSDGSLERIKEWCRSAQPLGWSKQFPGVERLTKKSPSAHVPVIELGANDSVPSDDNGVGLYLVQSGANLGFAGGCNVGVRVAGSDKFDYFWMLNSDTVMHRDALNHLLARFRRSAGLGMVGSTICFYDRPEIIQTLGGSEINNRNLSISHIGERGNLHSIGIDPSDVERRLVYIAGASMLVSSQFVTTVGLMQEDYFLYYEEFDWAIRGRPQFGLGFAPESVIFHKSGASSKATVSEFSKRMLYGNRLKFFGRFFPQHMATVRRQMLREMVSHAAHGRWVDAKVLGRVLWN